MSEIITNKRKQLLEKYETFVKEFGNINSARNKKLILQDSYGFIILSSLEVRIGNDFKPATVLYKSTKQVVEDIKTPDCIVALALSLSLYGEVNLLYIQDTTDLEEAEVIAELGDRIYFDPILDIWVTQEQFLSGNVFKKMVSIKQILKEFKN